MNALERKLDFLSSASRSAEDVGKELEKHEKQLEELNRNLDKLKEAYDYMKDDLANCTRRRHAEEMRKAELEKKVERTKALRGEENSLRTQKIEIEQQIEIEIEQLAPLLREKERYRKELEETRTKFKQEEDVSRNSVNAFDKEAHSLVNSWQKLLRYMESHKTKLQESEVHRVQQILDK